MIASPPPFQTRTRVIFRHIAMHALRALVFLLAEAQSFDRLGLGGYGLRDERPIVLGVLIVHHHVLFRKQGNYTGRVDGLLEGIVQPGHDLWVHTLGTGKPPRRVDNQRIAKLFQGRYIWKTG